MADHIIDISRIADVLKEATELGYIPEIIINGESYMVDIDGADELRPIWKIVCRAGRGPWRDYTGTGWMKREAEKRAESLKSWHTCSENGQEIEYKVVKEGKQ